MFRKIELSEIYPNKLNPRKFVADDDFNELVESVKQKGILQNILVREKPKNGKKYEIVLGERRFRAAKKVYQHYATKDTERIPADVRDIDDKEVFELMTVENLQRKNISPLEEAKGFHRYVQLHGSDGEAVEELATRVGKSASYIRRRVEVMSLPKKVTKAWAQGKIKFGHMEQLLRLKGNDMLMTQLFNALIDQGNISVVQFANWVDRETTSLKTAMFDTAECEKCFHNSEVQKSLFGTGLQCVEESILCLKPGCFKEKQIDYLETNWNKLAMKRKYKTNGFLIHEDTNYNEFANLYYNPEKKDCKDCPNFKTVLRTDGYIMYDQVCHGGSPSCIKKMNRDEARKDLTYDPVTGETSKKRGAWHGEHYRDEFFKVRIPARLYEIETDKEKIDKLTLYSILDSNHDIHEWFAEKIDHPTGRKKEDFYVRLHIPRETMWKAISEMDAEAVERLIREATQQIIVTSFTTWQRKTVAEYIGVDVKKEFSPTEEYLKKKLKADLIELGEKHKVFKKSEVRALMKKMGIKDLDVKNAKKNQLVELFAKSGIDLTGITPEEIVNAKCA